LVPCKHFLDFTGIIIAPKIISKNKGNVYFSSRPSPHPRVRPGPSWPRQPTGPIWVECAADLLRSTIGRHRHLLGMCATLGCLQHLCKVRLVCTYSLLPCTSPCLAPSHIEFAICRSAEFAAGVGHSIRRT
jgi:hypothetical protein